MKIGTHAAITQKQVGTFFNLSAESIPKSPPVVLMFLW